VSRADLVADRARPNILTGSASSMLTHHSSSSCMHVSRRGRVSGFEGERRERGKVGRGDFRCGGFFFFSCVALHTNRVFDTATAVVT
jgi:hypothetical protein